MMLSEQQIAEGWLPHDGGACPVDAAASVRIMLRDGSTPKWPRAGAVIWEYRHPIWEAGGIPLPTLAEVVAYKLEAKP